MKKTLQKIVTLLLVLTMLFGVMATTVAAANEPGGDDSAPSTGGVTTGWCDITYDDTGVVVVLNPDVQSILGINKSELKAIMNTVIDAAKALVIDDLKEGIKNKFEIDNAPSSGGVNAGQGMNADNIWEMAISGYIGSNEPSAYVDFLKNVLVDETEINGFATYATNLMISAVNLGIITLDKLPGIEDDSLDNLTEKLSGIFKNKIDSYVDETIKKEIPTYIDSYVALLQGDTSVTLDSSIVAMMDDYVALYVQDRVEAFIKAGFVKASDASTDVIIANYMDDIIVLTIDTWIDEYISGNIQTGDEDTVATVQSKLNTWISEIATKYPNGEIIENNPIWDALGENIEKKVSDTLDNYVTKYFNGELEGTSFVDEIEPFIKDKYAEISNSEKESDKAIINSVFNKVYDDYWNLKLNNQALTGVFVTIDATVKDIVLEKLEQAARDAITDQDVEDLKLAIQYQNPTYTEIQVEEEANRQIEESVATEAENAFNNLTTVELKAHVDENKDEAKAEILKLDLTSAFGYAEWKIVWDGLGASTQDGIKSSLKNTDFFKNEASNVIKENWSESAIKNQIASWKNSGSDEYTAIREIFITYAKENYASTITEKIRLKIYKSQILNNVDTLVYEEGNLVLDVAKTISTLKGVFAGEGIDKTALADAVKVEANKKIFMVDDNGDFVLDTNNEKIVSAEFKEMLFDMFLGYKNSDEVIAQAKVTLIPTFVEKYKEAYTALENNVAPEVGIDTLLEYVNFVKVNDKVVYEEALIKIDALKELFAELPRPEKIAEMKDEEMQLVYTFVIDTDFANISFDVTLRLGGGYDKVRTLARLISTYIDFGIADDGTIIFNLRVPAKFADLLLKVCETGKLPAELKEKVYALISGSPDDAVAFLNTLTLDELVKIIDLIPVEKIVNIKYLERFEKLDGLTAEQIKNKILTYREQFDKLITLVNKAYNRYVPEKLKDKTLAALYEGDGLFEYEGTHSVNVEKILSKVSEKYAALIASFVDTTTITASVDISVEFTNIKKVEYVVDGKVYRAGFLPVGANVAFFAGITEFEGAPILAWIDADGVAYSKMPNADITLYPLFTQYGEVTVSPTDVEKVYDGEAEILTAVFEAPEGVTVSYQWYKDGVLIEGATSSEYAVKNVLDSGVYYCVVTVVSGQRSETKTSNSVNVQITKNSLNLNDYTWKPESFVYDGTEKAVYLVDAEGNKLLLGVAYSGNKATNAGTYTASVVVDTDNFVVTGMAAEFEWVINKAVYDMSGVTFSDKVVIVNGEAHSIFITGTLPEGVTVSYSQNSFVEPGTYTVTATFTGNPNYEAIPDMTATLRILKLVKEHSYGDSVNIKSENGIPENYVLQFKDVTTQYNYVESENIFGDGNVGYVLAAYDIYFSVDAATQSVNDKFTVKLLIPANLRESNDALKVVHIAENGAVEDMDAVREGNYFVFETTHFSVYAIVVAGKAPVEPKEIDLTWLWVLLAILLVAAVVVVVIIIIKKRKSGDSEGTDNNGPAPKPVTEPVVEESAAEEPAVEEPAAEEPAAEEPAAEEPAAEEPAAEEPAAEEPAAEEPAAEEPAAEEPAVEEPAAEEPIAENPMPVKKILNLENAVGVRYRTSFMSRLIQAESNLQDYYTEVKNVLLSYKGVKARSSWNFESFNKGRIQCAKLNIKGSVLQVYLALDTNEYNANKYHFVDVSDKPKLDQVPMLLKVKSDRALKYTIELIEEMMQKLGMEKAEKVKYVDYHMPYETTEALAERELVKVILPKGVTLEDYTNVVKVDVSDFIDTTTPTAENATVEKVEIVEEPAAEEPVVEETVVEEAVAEEPVVEEAAVEEPVVHEVVTEETVAEETVAEEPVTEELHLDAVHADEVISDAEAEEKIEFVEKTVTERVVGNKLVEINLDTICDNFEDGGVVTLKALKEKKLVNKAAGRLKVLARGTMTKKLTVYADKFSIQAVKMITLAGGHADQYK